MFKFKPHSFIAAIFVWLLFLLSTQAKAQCTPGFLGSDRPLLLCGDVANIDYVHLFQVQASYSATALLPATDTIKRNGLPDTVIYHLVKLQVIATLGNGCKDTAIVRIPFPLFNDPVPNLGRDTNLIVCRGVTVDLTALYHPAPLTPVWSVAQPGAADTGRHTLFVINRNGCSDTATIVITNYPVTSLGNDTVVARNPGEKVNLFQLLDTARQTITWNTATPAAAPAGIYWAIGVDSNNCKDTAIIEVCQRPNLGADTAVKVCPGLTRSLYDVYNLTGLLPEFNTATPSSVGPGNYRLIVTNYCGGKDTVMIAVSNGIKPNIGIDLSLDICENETTNIEALYTFAALTPRWSLTDPIQAPAGVHRLIVKNSSGCEDTAFITVTALPRKPFYNDTTVYVCGGQTKDLSKVYPFSDEAIVEWINIVNETTAPEGLYTVAVEDDGCRYELKVTVASEATRNASITLCTYNTGNAPFTTNSFRSIIVDKQGFIWAGANGTGSAGGLYRFTRTGPECNQGTWAASNQFANSTYRDLHLSPIVGDNSLWCASNGYNGAEAVTGGIYQINSLASVTRYGSVLEAGGSLGSRFANGLTIAPNNKLYAALSVSLTAANVLLEGDVNEANLNAAVTFSRTNLTPANVPERRVSAVGMRGTELWAAFQQSCLNGTCSPPYIQRWNTISNASAGTVSQTNSPLPFTDNPSFIVRAIYTSSSGRTYIGLSGGVGFAVVETGNAGLPANWTLLNDQNSAFPKGGAVNFNAITEVNGEIWIGTTQGILVYDGVGPLTECSSYTLYNTSNGLPTNNVTDIAYDETHHEIWITHDAGVSRVTKTFTISGRVLNTFFGKYENDLFPTNFTRAIPGASVVLLDNSGVKKDSVITNNQGEFNLKNSLAGQLYKVRIKYKTYTYEYSNVPPNSFMGNVLIPDSLIQDLISLKAAIKQKEVAYTFPAEATFALVWKIPTFTIAGYDTTNFERAYEAYTGTIADKHQERLENLALYYCTLATINDIGKNANDLVEKAASQAVELITGIAEFAGSLNDLNDFQALWKQGGSSLNTSPGLREAFIADVNKLIDDGKKGVLKTLRSELDELLSEALRAKLDTSGRLVYDIMKAIINQVVDQLIVTEGGGDDIANLSKKDIKALIVKYTTAYLVKLIGGLYYKYYCTVKHDMLIPKLATYTRDVMSVKKYHEVYLKIYDKNILGAEGAPSINRQAIDRTDNANELIETDAAIAKSSSFWAGVTKNASNLALSTVALAELAPPLRVFSLALEGLSLGLQGISLGTAIFEGVSVGNLSDGVVGKTGFPAIHSKVMVQNGTCTPVSVALLNLAEKAYKEQLKNYRILINGSFDTTMTFPNRLRALQQADDAFAQQLMIAMQQIQARYKVAVATIPAFEGDMKTLTTSIMAKQAGARAAFQMENISYILAPVKTAIQPRLDSLIQRMIANNFAAVSFINSITNLLNQYCIPAEAYLVKTGFQLSSNFLPNSTGSFSYSFTNFGSETQNQVSFKISPPANGFIITSPDSIFVGSIAPNQTVSINYTYHSPNVDTTGDFTIKVKAANGYYSDQNGTLFTQRPSNNNLPVSVKSGLWSDPGTWSTNQVPTNVSAVTIKHQVTVDVNAICKSLKAESPGQVQVAAGKKLDILQ